MHEPLARLLERTYSAAEREVIYRLIRGPTDRCDALQPIRSRWRRYSASSTAGRCRTLTTASEGPFQALLARIGERLQTADCRTIAASFALRYG
jgi:hypothetical protein